MTQTEHVQATVLDYLNGRVISLHIRESTIVMGLDEARALRSILEAAEQRALDPTPLRPPPRLADPRPTRPTKPSLATLLGDL